MLPLTPYRAPYRAPPPIRPPEAKLQATPGSNPLPPKDLTQRGSFKALCMASAVAIYRMGNRSGAKIPGKMGKMENGPWLSSPNRAMQVCDAMYFSNPRCESRDFSSLDWAKTSDLCSAMCVAENYLCDAMRFHFDLRSRCGDPLRCRP